MSGVETSGDPPRSVLARGLLVVETVAGADCELRLSDVAERTGLPQPTAHRILTELVEWGVLDRSDRRYRLGARPLGAAVPGVVGLRDHALPVLHDLHAVTGAVVQLVVMESGDSAVVEYMSGRDVPSRSRIGDRTPAHAGAAGRAMLAFSDELQICRAIIRGFQAGSGWPVVVPEQLVSELERIRTSGVAFDAESDLAGFREIAAPIVNGGSRAVAAISIMERAGDHDTAQLGAVVRLAARSINRVVGQLGAAVPSDRSPLPATA